MSLKMFNRNHGASKGPNGTPPGSKAHRVYVANSNKVGSYVSEDEFESKFKKKGKNPKNYPQLSVQDYSTVKSDKKGKYVEKLKD